MKATMILLNLRVTPLSRQHRRYFGLRIFNVIHETLEREPDLLARNNGTNFTVSRVHTDIYTKTRGFKHARTGRIHTLTGRIHTLLRIRIFISHAYKQNKRTNETKRKGFECSGKNVYCQVYSCVFFFFLSFLFLFSFLTSTHYAMYKIS